MQFELHNAGNTEAQQKEAMAYLLAQASTGKAATGVLSGLAVAQTTTASGSVTVGAGAGVVQAAVLDGASVLVNDSAATVDVFTANPMGSLPRNDLVVFDAATITVRVIVGTANATPADPTIPTSCLPLARLRNAANATTIPTSAIDDLRTFTRLFVPASGRAFSGSYSVTTDASGLATVTHGAGFTPVAVAASPQSTNVSIQTRTFTSTTFQVRVLNASGTVFTGPLTFTAVLGG